MTRDCRWDHESGKWNETRTYVYQHGRAAEVGATHSVGISGAVLPAEHQLLTLVVLLEISD